MNSKFNKLLSNLPFNPSLIGQLAFYAKRLHKEESVRRLGVFFVLMAFAVQVFAIVSPPKPSLAASTNDLVYGGVHSLAELNSASRSGDMPAILNYFGVSATQLSQARDASVDSRGANASKYYSMGRTLAGRTDSVQISIPGTITPTYMRTLGGWAQQVWPAYQVPSTRFGQIWILKDCGNIVTVGLPPAGPPRLSITKTSSPAPNSAVKPGQRIHYTLLFSNKGSGPATHFSIDDPIPNELTNIQIGPSGAFEYLYGHDFKAYWAPLGQPSNLGPNPTQDYQVNFYATVRSDVKPGTFCNKAVVKSDQGSDSSTICHVVRACPYNPLITPENPKCTPPPAPAAVCTSLNARFLSRTKVEFQATAKASNGATINSLQFDTGSGTSSTVDAGKATGSVTRSFTFDYPGTPAPKSYTARVTALTSLGNKTSTDCVQTIEIAKEKLPLVVVEKTVSSAGTQKASEIKANPGQAFTFTFTIRNLGDADASNFALPKDNITDALEYADVTNLNGASKVMPQGDTNTYLTWAPVTIKAQQTLTRSVDFKMKDVLPKTNTPPSNPQSFDCRIQNSIGTTSVTVDIDQSNCITKVIEQATTSLPNTGPGASMVIGFGLTTVVSYFFFRNRLMAKELDLVRLEYASGSM